MKDIVYLRMRDKIEVRQGEKIRLEQIAHLTTNVSIEKDLKQLPIYQLSKKDKQLVVIDSFIVLHYLIQSYPKVTFQLLGPEQTIITIHNAKRHPPLLLTTFVWLLLFIGTAMTIMNFHYDVNMQEVQQKLHYFLTGEKTDFPLWIQIPYSFGLGIGMLVFFNHWFNKRFNEEPSPLEIEMFNYEQNQNEYIRQSENLLNDQNNRN